MKRPMRPGLTALPFLLTACAGFPDAGARQDERPPLPPGALRACAAPWAFFPPVDMTQGQAEIAVGRMGDELLRCGGEKAALAGWAQGVQDDLAGGAR